MRRRKERSALAALVLGALALIAGGGYWAAELTLSHRPVDLAYSEGPKAFQAWLSQAGRGDAERRDLAAAIAKRLLAMPIAARRRTAAAMTDESFWRGAAAGEAERRALKAEARRAVLRALRQAPASGDLWLAAASLHTTLDGFDGRAAGYLTASYRFSPREGQVAYGRAGLLSHVLPLLDGDLAELATSDLELIAESYPRLSRDLAGVLSAAEKSDARR